MRPMNIADRIKLRMSALKLTQEGVANRAGISQGMVYKLISGKAKSTSKLIELADALECDIEWLGTGKTDVREQSARYKTQAKLTVKELKRQLAALPPNTQKAIALEIMESLIDAKTD